MDILVRHKGQLETINITSIADDGTALRFPDKSNEGRSRLITVTDFLNEYEVISVMREAKEEDFNNMKSE